jgi:hypothetical protein
MLARADMKMCDHPTPEQDNASPPSLFAAPNEVIK